MEQQARIPRQQMVERDLVRRGIKDPRLLAAFMQVPRHFFVEARLRYQAYQPTALPIYGQQSISQPYVVALMTEQLKLNADAKVLDVGTGSGYQAAILSRLCQRVYAVERLSALVHTAKQWDPLESTCRHASLSIL